MKTYKTKAFALSGYVFGESHKILSLFSSNLGRCDVVAYNIRKTKNNYGGILEFFNEIFIILKKSHSENLYTIKEVELIKNNNNLKNNLSCISYLYYLSSFLINITPKGFVENKIYLMIERIISNSISYPEFMYVFIRRFELKVLEILGFLPDLFYCSHSNKKITLNDQRVIVCDSPGWIIKEKYRKYYNNTRVLSYGAYKIILNILYKDIKKVMMLKFNNNLKLEIDKAFNLLIRSITGKNIYIKII